MLDSLIGEQLTRITFASSSEADIPLFRLAFQSGRKVEVWPTEYKIASPYPGLTIILTDVGEFTPMARWPNGPLHPEHEIVDAAKLYGSPIIGGSVSDPHGEGAITAISVAFANRAILTIEHFWPPMSLHVKVAKRTA